MFNKVLVSYAKFSIAINAFGSFLYASVLNQHVLAAQPLLELGVREPAGPELLRVGLLGGSFGDHREFIVGVKSGIVHFRYTLVNQEG